MLEHFVQEEDILLQQTCKNWEEAIDCSTAPLLARGVIELSYREAIKKNHRELPYMVIAPGIMLAHARPECGAHGVGITLMTLKRPVSFGHAQNDPVSLVITLATPDDTSHVKLLEALMEFLMDDAARMRFLTARTIEEAFSALEGSGSKAMASL